MSERKRKAPRGSLLARRQARQRRLMQIVIVIFSILLVLSMILSLTSSF